MRILVLCNHQLGLPTIVELGKAGLLVGIATSNQQTPFLARLAPVQQSFSTPLLKVNRGNFQKKIGQFIKNKKIDVVFVLTFGYKITAKLLSMPKWGFINFHPGPLPQYRGPDPVFWQLKRQLSKGTMTVHQMDAQFDQGPVIGAMQFPITPQMTHSHFMSEAGYAALQLASGIIQLLSQTGQLPLQAQDQKSATYLKRPTFDQRRIQWQQQDAESVQALINACNIAYGGAIALFRQQPLQILQVTPLNERQQRPVGQIVYADATWGWVVICRDGQLLKIEVVQSGEGIMTGWRFVEMALVRVGEALG